MSTLHTIFASICITALLVSTIALSQITDLNYVIAEECPAMTLVGNVREDSNVRRLVTPSDLLDLRFTFLTEGNPQTSYLWINSTSGELRTSSRINRETICPKLHICELRVQTVIQAQLRTFFEIIQVKVIITDINDNSPTFSPSMYTLRIAESETPGVSFKLPTATDLDVGVNNSVIDYNSLATEVPFTLIVLGNASTSFDIRIRLDGNLDRETTASYQFFIRAVDRGKPSLTGTLTVNLEVMDVNDNSPVFQQKEYSANISDSTSVNSVVTVVKAIDSDAGENGQVTYKLPSIGENIVVLEMFRLNESTGEITTKVLMDSYAGRSYRMIIEAQDSGYPHRTDRADVVISVMDTHNSQPEILLNVLGTGGRAQISEVAELGRAVAHVAVSDPDSSLSPNGMVSCSVNNTDQFQLQAMDAKQFKVIVTKRLDREQQIFHRVTVVCEDSGTPPLNVSSSFVIEVIDENDNAPAFDFLYYQVHVTEGRSPGAGDKSDVILTVHASDRDTGLNAQLTYLLAAGTDSDFGIYTDGSIVVTNSTSLDREDKVKGGVRRLVVLAVDSGKVPLTGTATVEITIKDVNDNHPRFSEPMYLFNVSEAAARGHIIGNVSADDADLDNSGIVCFKMHHRYINSVPFEVSLGGVVTVVGNIDREVTSSYKFYVVAYDMGEPTRLSSTVAVRIKVNDENDNSPTFVFPNNINYTTYIPHTLSEDNVFVTISAKDIDEGRNSELVYTMENGNGSYYFDIDPESGQVSLVHPLTVSEIGLHIVTVGAKDRGLGVHIATTSTLHIVVYEGNATVSLQNTALGLRNFAVVVALVVITAILSVTIFLTILLIRRVDKQRRLYSTKGEEAKACSRLKHLNPGLGSDSDSTKTISGMADVSGDGEKRMKEVCFSLKVDSHSNKVHTMSTFNTEKYDCFLQSKEKMKVAMSVHQLDDNESYTSSDVSTCDSGKGGSDAELQSSTGVSKDTGAGNTSLISQRGLESNNFNSMRTDNINNHLINSKNSIKSVQFQNICSDSVPFGIQVSVNTATSIQPGLHRPTIRQHVPTHKNGLRFSRYHSNIISTENINYISLANNNRGQLPHLSSLQPELNHDRLLSDNILSNQNNQYSTNLRRGYMDETELRPYIPQRYTSNAISDYAGTWDGDTTTSGSYTVDHDDGEIDTDTLFFGSPRDIVV